MLKKFLILTLLFVVLVLLQTSFLAHFSILGIVPNVVLIAVVILTFSEKQSIGSFYSWVSIVAAFEGGFFLDVFSSLPFGTITVTLLVIVLLIKKIFGFVKNESILWFIFVLAFSVIFYDLFLTLSGYLFLLLTQGSSEFQFYLYYPELIAVLYNMALGILVFKIKDIGLGQFKSQLLNLKS